MIFKVSSRIFFTNLPIHLFTGAYLCFIEHIHFVFVFIFVKVLLPAFTIPEIESERKISLNFWIIFGDYINLSIYLILYYYFINLFNYFLYICCLLALCFRRRQSETFFCLNVYTQENWVISHLKPMFLSYRNKLFDLHDKLT